MAASNLAVQCGPLVAAFIVGAVVRQHLRVPRALYPHRQTLNAGKAKRTGVRNHERRRLALR
jgi:hypothetical protein